VQTWCFSRVSSRMALPSREFLHHAADGDREGGGARKVSTTYQKTVRSKRFSSIPLTSEKHKTEPFFFLITELDFLENSSNPDLSESAPSDNPTYHYEDYASSKRWSYWRFLNVCACGACVQ
jgi:hypothetical protein